MYQIHNYSPKRGGGVKPPVRNEVRSLESLTIIAKKNQVGKVFRKIFMSLLATYLAYKSMTTSKASQIQKQK